MNWNLIIEVILAALTAWQWKRAREGRSAADAVVEFLPDLAGRITEARTASVEDIPPYEKDTQHQFDNLVGDVLEVASKKKAAKPLVEALNRLAR